MNIIKLAKRLRDGKERILLQSDGQLNIESTKEVVSKEEVGDSVYELLTQHAEYTFEQQAIVSRLIPHAKGL